MPLKQLFFLHFNLYHVMDVLKVEFSLICSDGQMVTACIVSDLLLDGCAGWICKSEV